MDTTQGDRTVVHGDSPITLAIRTLIRLKPTSTCVGIRVLGVCALLFAHSLSAQDAPVRFCFSAWPPYTYMENGEARGLSTVVLREAARRAGLIAEFVELPWKRCLHLVDTGEHDAAVDAAKREQFLQGPTSFSVYTNTFWVRDAAPMQAFSIEALRNKKVGLVSGYVYPDELVKEPPYSIDYSVDDDMNVRKLAGGRVDAIVADLVSTLRIAKSRDVKLRALQPSHSLDRLYPSFNAQRGDQQTLIDKALQEMTDDGYIEDVYRTMLGLDFRTVLGTNAPASGN